MEAAYYKKLEENAVQCELCSHQCVILHGEMGLCKCRVNDNGTLIAKTYGEISGLTTESLSEMGFHFYPDASLHLLSISGYGCNMQCPYCANKHISQGRIHTEHLDAESLCERLRNLKQSVGVRGVCYTFNEPLIWFEHVRDYAKLVHDAGFMNAMETNGMIHPDAFRSLLPVMDLVNIDYKGFDADFYRGYLHGDYDNVLENIGALAASGVYYEVTVLIIQDVNDDERAFEAGMQRLQAVAPDAPVNLMAVLECDQDCDLSAPSEDKMAALCAIAKKYFEQVAVVKRETCP